MIRFNPCGKAVDLARRSYRTMARLFSDSDELTEILWYPADPKAGTLPFPSAVTSRAWDTTPWVDRPIGEVPFAPRVFDYQKPKVGTDNDHVCGTAQEHVNGCKRLPDEPPVEYAANGLPLCCGIPAVVPDDGDGGMVFGGEGSGETTTVTTCEMYTISNPFWGLGTHDLYRVAAGVDQWASADGEWMMDGPGYLGIPGYWYLTYTVNPNYWNRTGWGGIGDVYFVPAGGPPVGTPLVSCSG